MIELSQVSKSYGDHIALNNVSLSIKAGTFVALVGPSGSGKTTLLKTINRLITPDEGQIEINGRDITAQPAYELRRSIGYAFQGIGLFPHMTVAENIALVPSLSGGSEGSKRVDELLDLIALPRELASRFPRALSGGQAQRVGFARALAAKPKLMLLDEPFGALDPVSRNDLGHAYRALHDQLGLTSILVTHDMTEALLLSDRVIVLKEGHIIADAPPADYLRGIQNADVEALINVPLEQLDRLSSLRDLA